MLNKTSNPLIIILVVASLLFAAGNIAFQGVLNILFERDASRLENAAHGEYSRSLYPSNILGKYIYIDPSVILKEPTKQYLKQPSVIFSSNFIVAMEALAANLTQGAKIEVEARFLRTESFAGQNSLTSDEIRAIKSELEKLSRDISFVTDKLKKTEEELRNIRKSQNASNEKSEKLTLRSIYVIIVGLIAWLINSAYRFLKELRDHRTHKLDSIKKDLEIQKLQQDIQRSKRENIS